MSEDTAGGAEGTVSTWVMRLASGTVLGAKAMAVVNLMATQPDFCSHASTTKVAARSGVNAATVTRVARTLGFSGWPALRLELRARAQASKLGTDLLRQGGLNASEPSLRAISCDVENLNALAGAAQPEVVRLVADAVVGADRTIVAGSGSYAGPAVQLSHTATVIGLDVRHAYRGGTTLINSVLRLRPGDCFVVFSFWRIPRELLRATQLAYARGVTTCVVTDLQHSELASAGTHVLTVPTETVTYFPSVAACSSLVNAIVATMVDELGDDAIARIKETETVWHDFDLNYNYARQ